MKPLLLWLIVAAAVFASAPARASEPVKITVQTGVASQYLFSDGTALHAAPIEHMAILGKLPLGLMLGVWGVSGMDDLSPRSNGGDEIAVGGGWNMHTENLVFEVGVKHHANAGSRGQTTIPEIEAGFVVHRDLEHKLELYMNAEFPVRHNLIVSELSAGAEHVWRLIDTISIRHRAAIQYNSPAHGHDEVYLLSYRLGVAWSVLKREHLNVTLIGPTVRLYAPIIGAHGYEFQQAYGASVDVSWQQ